MPFYGESKIIFQCAWIRVDYVWHLQWYVSYVDFILNLIRFNRRNRNNFQTIRLCFVFCVSYVRFSIRLIDWTLEIVNNIGSFFHLNYCCPVQTRSWYLFRLRDCCYTHCCCLRCFGSYLKVPRYDLFQLGVNYIRHSVELNSLTSFSICSGSFQLCFQWEIIEWRYQLAAFNSAHV